MIRPIAFTLAASAAGFVAATAGGATPAAPATAGKTVAAAADAYVTPRRARANYGRKKTLAVGGALRARSYLRFAMPARPLGGSQTATLRLYVVKPGGRVSVRTVRATRWSERRLTAKNAPRTGAVGASFVPRKRGYVTVDVTPLVRSGALSLALTGGRKGAVFASREAGRRGPRAVVASTAAVVAAGDIAGCDTTGDEQTAPLVAASPGIVAVLGDNAYERGTATEYANCYGPTWGAFKSRTRPAPGNHEYETSGAAGYYSYFGAAAHPPFGYYSYDLGGWHVVVLNSNCFVAGCNAGSQQESWLRSDLAAHPARCTLAYWHHPRFSSGQVTSDPQYLPFWQDLYNAGADLVLVGHSHTYQRYAPQTPTGALDNARGIREIVVGTGGRSHHSVTPTIPNEQVADATAFGVLRLTLTETGYSWQFVPVPGAMFRDSGTASCH